MNSKAQHLTVDAIICLLFVGAIAAVPLKQQGAGLGVELLLFQQENDLMKAWLSEEGLSLERMGADAEKIFEGRKVALVLGSERMVLDGFGSRAVASETFCVENGKLLRLRVIAYY